jgi:proline iminopeptidase
MVGHSWGADLALAYGLAYGGNVSSIVSFAGTGVQNDRDWHAVYEAHIDEEPHDDYQYHPNVHDQLLADWRSFIKTPDLLARIAALQVPITFLHCTNDIRPSWPAQQLAHLAPHGRYLELADAPHEAWLTHRDALVRVLREILIATAP